MQKGERVDPFLTKPMETRDELSAVGLNYVICNSPQLIHMLLSLS